jgi:hypothetical protein
MKKFTSSDVPTFEVDTLTIHSTVKAETIRMSRRCDNCGHSKEPYGAKTCSKGHFICHSCASGHVHCPLCGHTLR